VGKIKTKKGHNGRIHTGSRCDCGEKGLKRKDTPLWKREVGTEPLKKKKRKKEKKRGLLERLSSGDPGGKKRRAREESEHYHSSQKEGEIGVGNLLREPGVRDGEAGEGRHSGIRGMEKWDVPPRKNRKRRTVELQPIGERVKKGGKRKFQRVQGYPEGVLMFQPIAKDGRGRPIGQTRDCCNGKKKRGGVWGVL